MTRQPSSSRARGTALSVGSAVLFGTSGSFAAAVMAVGWSPVAVSSARITSAAVLLLLVVAITRPAALRIRGRDLGLLFGLGLFGVVVTQLLFFVAVSRLPVSIAMLLEFTAPVLVALWVRVVRRTRLRGPVWLGIALAMAGLCLIAQVWQGLRLDLLGFLAGLGSAIGTAGYYLIGQRGAQRHDPIGLTALSLGVGAVLIAFVHPPWTLPLHLFDTPTTLGGGHPPVWLVLALITVFSTALPYVAGTVSLTSVPPALASVLGLIEPLVATITAWLLLGQQLDAVQLAGGLVLLGGAVIVQLYSKPPVEPFIGEAVLDPAENLG